MGLISTVASTFSLGSLLLSSITFADVPLYKPSSNSPMLIDISLNQYGANDVAPEALGIGDIAPDFALPRAGGGTYTLSESVEKGSVAIIFYRDHW